ncbi:integrating conjugative element protein [Legionella pneumophila subsp. fraseri]|nr:integrating conjugative element protein [Legionella pneumophila subsp. fraseri]HAT1795170.1 integrating conjugative element protein [Legionella pneumophila]MDW8961993.1 integrating conjugative element protein [Legionella pneumophila subsp. fraseri]MDW9036473.1 integrating conjugative element protein [Legionella pneumophila subsp. fraseri]MDW9039745.1 integrating conjugative element protein [Legionella pneumophila subsp. fraseri]
MMRILLLLLVTFHAYSMNVIPLTLVQSDNAMQLNLSSPIGVPAKSKATVGKVNRKNIPSNLININLFIIGADRFSYQWLEAHQEELKSMQALGFITNVNDFETIVALQNKFKLPLLPVNVDPLLDFVHEHHYPLIIAEGALWQ